MPNGRERLGARSLGEEKEGGGSGLFISHFWHRLPKFFQLRKCSHSFLRQHLIAVVLAEDSSSLLQTHVKSISAVQGTRKVFWRGADLLGGGSSLGCP